MIQQLKDNVFDIDLHKAIEEVVKFETNIQSFLQEINKQRIPDSLVQILFVFKALFIHIFRDIPLKTTYDAHIQHK